jgi:ketosteroid isomerase-like protein
LEKEIQYLMDRRAILDRVHSYPRAVDRHDIELIHGVFHPDAWDDHGKFVGTVPDFAEWVNGVHEATEAGHTHDVTTHLCDIDGDVAHTESYVLWALRRKDGQSVMLGSGRYLDRLEKRDGEWKISLRRTVTDMRLRADGSSFANYLAKFPTGSWDRNDPTFRRPFGPSMEQLTQLGPSAVADTNIGTDITRDDMNAEEQKKALRYLLDRQEIVDCVNRYCRGLDRHDKELLASAFHPDAIDHHGPFLGYAPEFVDWAVESTSEDLLAHTHNTTCHIAQVKGDVAETESYVIFALRHKDEKTVSVGGGRYLDRLERRDGAWRIAWRQLVMDWRFQADGTIFNSSDGYEHGKRDKSDLSYMRPLELTADQKQKLVEKYGADRVSGA